MEQKRNWFVIDDAKPRITSLGHRKGPRVEDRKSSGMAQGEKTRLQDWEEAQLQNWQGWSFQNGEKAWVEGGICPSVEAREKTDLG